MPTPSPDARRLGDALRASEGFTFLVGALPDVVLALLPDGEIAYAPPRLIEDFGLRPESVEGLRLRDLVHPDDHGVLPGRLAPDDGGTAWAFRVRRGDASAPGGPVREQAGTDEDGAGWRRATGSVAAPEARGALANVLGEGVLLFLRSGHRHATPPPVGAEQGADEQPLRALFDSAPLAMGVVQKPGPDIVHRRANPAAVTFFDREADDVENRTFDELGFTEAEAERWDDAFLRCLADGAPVRFETTYPWDSDPEGEGVRSLHVIMAFAGGGDTPLVAYVMEDVTERRRDERQRRLLHTAVESALDPVVITDAALDAPGPRIVYVNPAFERMTGYRRDEVLGRNPRFLQGPKTDRAVLDRFRRQLQAGETFRGEIVNYRKDGASFVLAWEVAPVHDGDGVVTHWVATQRDMTERRALERHVLDAATREQERIARDLHDGLAQVLAGSAYLARAAADDLFAAHSAHAEDVGRVADLLGQAVRQARALAHGLHPVRLMAEGLQAALERLAEATQEAYGVACTFHGDPTLFASGDEAAGDEAAMHLYRIAQEAVSNAARHGQARHILLALDRTEHGGEAALIVQDDGVGITDAALERGGGLGLYTMQYRAHAIGGALAAEPVEDGGTLIRCRFPLAGLRSDEKATG